MPMTIDVRLVGGAPQVAVIGLAGELDASNYELLVEAVGQAYAEGCRGLVLDLGGLTFMASSGLVALYSAVRIMRGEPPPDPESGWGTFHDMEDDRGAPTGTVRLARLQPAVERVLDRTGMKQLCPVDDGVDEAVDAIRGA
jgi:anti-anti-sigma factor